MPPHYFLKRFPSNRRRAHVVKCCFCSSDHFYRPQPKIMVVDLLNMEQQMDEMATNFKERFRKLSSKCMV